MSNISLRIANEFDEEEIIGLLNNVFSEQQRTNVSRSVDYWRWKCQQNPFGQSILSVIEVDGKIVGCDHLWQWQIKCRNEVLKAVQPCDSVVDPNHTGKGYFRKLRTFGLNRAQIEGVNFSFNFPNKNSLPLNQSLGNIVYGSLQWRVKILKPVVVFKSFFGARQANPTSIESLWHIDPNLLDEIASCTEKYDKFLRINRIEGFHAWRYVERPTREYGMVSTTLKSKKGAVIFTINQKGDLKEMVIVDILGDAEMLSSVMIEAEKAAKKMGCGFVAMMENPQFNTQLLLKKGYIKKHLKYMVALPFDSKLEYTLGSKYNWSMVAGLHDSI